MIARVWRGETRAEQADRYHQYLLETGLTECRETPGNVGVTIWRRAHGDAVEFVFTSLWSSWEAIRAFAGEDLDRAVYYPADREFLLSLEPTVTHYEVVTDVRAENAS